MNMRKTKTGTGKVNGFPAEAALVYDEVSQEAAQDAREETAKMIESGEWELLDGINFPYPKCA